MRNSAGSFVVAATLLAAPPSWASEIVDVVVKAGLPRTTFNDGRGFAWRNVAVRAESERFDLAVELPSCLGTDSNARPPTPSFDAPSCPLSRDALAAARPQYALTLKLPQSFDNGPYFDVVLRQSGSLRWQQGSYPRGSSYRGVEISVTQPVGSLELFAGTEMPISTSSPDAAGRSAYAGIAWHLPRAMVLELASDFTDRPDVHPVERAWTIRLARSAPGASLRYAAWLTRWEDDLGRFWLGGVGLEYRY